MWNQNSSASESRKNISVLKKSDADAEGSEENPKVTLGDKGELENQSEAIDSGFLSGPQLYSSEILESDTEEQSKPVTGTSKPEAAGIKNPEQEYTDSGCLEDIDSDIIDKKAISQMLLDRGVDAGLTEWFCNLSLKNANQPLNDLDQSGKTSLKSSEPTATAKEIDEKDKSKSDWEIYYQQNDDGDTQLHLACIMGYVEVVLALIRLSPHPCLFDIQNDEAQTALHLAVLTGQHKIVRILLMAGAEPSIQDRNGNTPLHLACTSGNLDCVKALTIPINGIETVEARKLNISKSGEPTRLPPNLEQRNYDGERCVHLAAQGNHLDVLKHLVCFGADINAREGKSGKTPLHMAIGSSNETLVHFLLEECQKLDLETETYAGITAYQLAAAGRNQKLQTHLKLRGAEPLTPPESDDEIDFDSDDFEIYDRFGDPGFFVSAHSGSSPINVM